MSLATNPIVAAFQDNCVDFDPDCGQSTISDVIETWIHYMAVGDQDISWDPEHLAGANKYFKHLADIFELEYTPGMTAPAKPELSYAAINAHSAASLMTVAEKRDLIAYLELSIAESEEE